MSSEEGNGLCAQASSGGSISLGWEKLTKPWDEGEVGKFGLCNGVPERTLGQGISQEEKHLFCE